MYFHAGYAYNRGRLPVFFDILNDMAENSLDLHQLSDIYSSYSQNVLVKAEKNTTAFANEVYDITDTEGLHYVMRILKTQLPEVVATEALMQKSLAAARDSTK